MTLKTLCFPPNIHLQRNLTWPLHFGGLWLSPIFSSVKCSSTNLVCCWNHKVSYHAWSDLHRIFQCHTPSEHYISGYEIKTSMILRTLPTTSMECHKSFLGGIWSDKEAKLQTVLSWWPQFYDSEPSVVPQTMILRVEVCFCSKKYGSF